MFGPPRSGTSVVSHALEKLGAYFGEPEDFLDPALHTHNPVFYELEVVNRVNDEICRAMGGEYVDFWLLPDPSDYTDLLYERFAGDILAIVRGTLKGASTIGIKDPRFVLTLPFWRRALEAEGYDCRCVVTMRQVDAAVASNALVNGFSADRNRRIVMFSNLLAAWQASSLPAIEVDFDAALADPEIHVGRMADLLATGSDSIAEAAAVFDGRLRHQTRPPVHPTDDAVSLEGRAEAYEALLGTLEDSGVGSLVVELRSSRAALQERLASQEWLLASSRAAHADAEARCGQLIEGHLALMAASPHPGTIRASSSKLYGICGNGEFDESLVVLCEMSCSAGMEIATVDVPHEMLDADVRFDPDQSPGVYSLRAVVVDGRPVGDLSSVISGIGGSALGDDSSLLVSPTDDPWWRLSLNGIVERSHAANVRVEFHFMRLSWGEVAASRLGIAPGMALLGCHNADLEAVRFDVSRVAQSIASSTSDLEATLSQVGAKLESLDGDQRRERAEISQWRQSLERRLEEQRAQLRELREEVAGTRRLQEDFETRIVAALATSSEQQQRELSEFGGRLARVSELMERRTLAYWSNMILRRPK